MELGFELFSLEHFLFAVKHSILIVFFVFLICFSLYGLSFILRKLGYIDMANKAKTGSNNIWKFIIAIDTFLKNLFAKNKG